MRRAAAAAADSTTLQVGALTAAVTFLSAFMKNVGTLGIFMPIAIQAAERSQRPPSLYLMPLAFGSLVGGTITQIGTSPNLLISAVRQEVMGQPYRLVRLHPGRAAAIHHRGGVPQRRLAADPAGPARAAPSAENDVPDRGLHDRGAAPRGLAAGGQDRRRLGGAGRRATCRSRPSSASTIAAISPAGTGRCSPATCWCCRATRWRSSRWWIRRGSKLARRRRNRRAQRRATGRRARDGRGGRRRPTRRWSAGRPEELRLRQRYEVNLLALAAPAGAAATRLRHAGSASATSWCCKAGGNRMPETLSRLGCLPLAERNLALGRPDRGLIPRSGPGRRRSALITARLWPCRARLLRRRRAGGAVRRRSRPRRPTSPSSGRSSSCWPA